ncbi:MAG: hypothetical protein K0R82_267, partial [Flavipsychrobacter sp.]|nr:hypothetical protein [Flavipsychrobacter sp.]
MKHFNNLRQLCLVSLLLALSAIPAFAQPLSGTYTIGGTSPSYATLTAAVNDLNSKGVSAPVTFNIRTGTYTDRVIIGSVAGASSTNRITFKAETGNAADVTINNSASTTTDNFVFKLNTANYITIRNLTLATSNSTYCTTVDLAGASAFDSIVSCNLNGPISTYTGYYGALIHSYTQTTSNIVIKNNNITNGGSGIYLYQSSAGATYNNYIIEGNNFSGQYYMPTYLYYTRDLKLRNNTFTKTTGYGYTVYSYYAYDAYECTGNIINMNNCNLSTVYGLLNAYCQGSASNPAKRALVANNTLTHTNITQSIYAIYNTGSTFMTFRDNTVNSTTTSGGYVVMDQSCPGMIFRGNNITYNSNSTTYCYQTYQSDNAIIDSNTFNVNVGAGAYYPYYYYPTNVAVRNNTFNITSTTGTIQGAVYAVYTTNNSGFEISGNQFNVSSTSGTVYGVYVSGTTGTPDMGLKVFNNVMNVKTSGTNYGFYCPTLVGNNQFYNNTFHSRATGSTNYCFYIAPSSGSNIVQNNIFSRTGTTGVMAYIGNAALSNVDHNLYYATSGNLVQSTTATASFSNLQAWRNTTGKDKNSLVYDPGYISATSANIADLAPDVTNANAWARNGRGNHIPGNNKDINGAVRAIDRPSGVPDIGAHEFTPTATPPAATANPAAPVANGTQVFTLGQDTVVTIAWGASVPPSALTVRQYTGTVPPTISSVSGNNMYFYTDVNVPSGTYGHTSNLYYQDPWAGTVSNESSLRLAKKDGANPWLVYTPGVSTTNTTRNIITTTGSNNFGLHTGVDQGDNAGTNVLTAPVAPFCTGNQTVMAQIKNSGNNILNNVQVGWSVDGIAQAPLNYTTAINTLGSGLGNTATVSLGTVNFGATPKVIKVWTYLPNGVPDVFTSDDTITVTLRSSLSGVYTIGGTTPNYTTIQAAINDLNSYGVCGPVFFDIRNGTYSTNQYVLKPVIGASAVNRITFRSETANPANVTVSFNVTSTANNYVFLLDSAKYFTFKDLTVRSTNTTYGYSFEFRNLAAFDSIVGCRMNPAATTSSSAGGIYAYQTFKGSDIFVANNTFTGGYYGVYVYGLSAAPSRRFTIDGNTFNNQYYYAVNAYYANELKIHNNAFNGPGSNPSYWYPIYTYYCNDGRQIVGNTFTSNSSATTYIYPIYTYYCTGAPGSYGLIRNNTWNITNTNGSGYVYYYNYQSVFDSVVNNTMNFNSNYYIYNYYYYPSNNYFAQNTQNFNAGYMYSYWYWSGTTNNIVENNTMNYSGTNYWYWYQYYYNNAIVRNNLMNLTSTGTSVYNYFYYPNNTLYENNTVNVTAASIAYGLLVQGSSGTYQNTTFRNNRFKVISNASTAYGFYNASNDKSYFYNNVVTAQGSTNYAFYCASPVWVEAYNNTLVNKNASGYVLYSTNTGSAFLKLRNNIIYSSAATSGMYFTSATAANLNSDYNNVFVGGTNKFANPTNYTSLSAWRNATGQDMNSLMFNPGFTSPSTDNYVPDATNSFSWSLNGRAEHIAGNNKDFLGNTRVTTKAAGVPDIGAYEFTPTATPPSATATPAAPAAGITQTFTLGEDTVATVSWDASATVPSTIDVKQYSGVQPPTFIAANSMYIYTDIVAGNALHSTKFYYKDPQTGTTIGESGLRLVKKDGANPWTVFSNPQTATNAVLNSNNTTNLNDFGYHTLTDVPNNASTTDLVAPVTAFCAPSTQEVKVKIKNTGNNILNSVKIGWTKDGVPQSTITYTTPIYTFGSPQGNEAIISLGNVTFSNSNAINFVVYTFSPNNATDPAPSDDTLKFSIKPSLSGTYTIGGTTPDYLTVPDAIKDLNLYGVCGPVVFNIRDGNYTDGGRINAPLQGSSAVNRVTFQSESGIANNVVITHAATSITDNHIFGLANISYITLRNLKMVTTNASFSTSIDMSGSASYDTVIGCILQAPTSTSSSYQTSPLQGYTPAVTGTMNVIRKNTITNGGTGIYLYSTGGASKNIIDSNTITGPGYYGVYLNYHNGIKFRGNTVTTASSAVYGFNMQYCYASGTTSSEIVGNTLNMNVNSTAYPIYTYYFNNGGSNSVRGKITDNVVNVNNGAGSIYNYMYYHYYTDHTNNVVSLTGGYLLNYEGYNSYYSTWSKNKWTVNAGYGYALYPSYSQYCKFTNNALTANFGSTSTAYGAYCYGLISDTMVNNSFVINSTYSSSNAVYFYLSSAGSYLRNNLFANYSSAPGGIGAYMYVAAGSSSDYNNMWAASGSHISNNGAAATLQQWRTASSNDRNSLCYDPGIMNSASDAHPDPNNPASWSLNGRGEHIGWNNTDLEGNPRVTTLAAGVPDIGAYEFVPNSTPPLATAIPATPAVGKQTFTFGQDTVAVIDWKVNSQIPNNVDVRQYTGTVPPSFPAVGHMYFYTDVSAANSTYDFTADMYYDDPWRGTITTEGNIRMAKKLNPQAWQAYNSPLSSVDVTRNIIRAGLTNVGYMTGIEDGGLFSAIITPQGSGIFCPGGSVVLNANTGIGYTYQWQFNYADIPGATGPSLTATAAGDYTVKITNTSNVTATSLAYLVTIVAPPAAQ